MPELPEVETIRRDLGRELPGRRVLRVPLAAPAMLRGLPAARLRRAVEGRRFLEPRRHGKLLQLPLEGGVELQVHLGMSGRLVVEPSAAPRAPHTHVELSLEGGRSLRYRDPRRFGRWALVEGGRTWGRVFAHAGVDPLQPEFDAAALRALLKAGRGEVKRLLLDQSRVAGLGNIYVCEALHRARIHPARRADTLGPPAAGRLHRAILEVLNAALEHRGTTLLDYRDAGGAPGAFQRQLGVYGRRGQPCPRCGRTVRRAVQGGRSTFWCPGCQRRR
ncbi:MAG TPA: bifunctional DNA-formamidopyrimidine glycosylase/DNA-(apurinic or apyrimidinic site) lyase [Candidatus Saccharimonadales bacterium]|nr:bifunctional DNA-formamidopyrimidine glycosylase/DNA-(apurinic or apyrimidinic site) lyase [Candidatus Saccharimonadales bacterium]